MNQFYRFDAELKNNKELNNDEKVAYMYLYDRMCSSVKRSDFFDKVKNDYYVIYTVDEMIEDLNVSKNTVIKVFKKLENLGYIIAKKISRKATRFFIPNFTSSKIEPNNNQNLNPNHTNLNQKYTSETNVTSKKSKTVIDKNNKQIHISSFDIMQNLVDSLKKKACFGQDLINLLVKYSENAGILYNYAKLIFKAKKSTVAKLVKSGKSVAKEALRFENNISLMSELTDIMKSLIITTRSNSKIKNKPGYITSALHEFFTNAVGGYMSIERHAKLINKTKGFNIPLIKLDK